MESSDGHVRTVMVAGKIMVDEIDGIDMVSARIAVVYGK